MGTHGNVGRSLGIARVMVQGSSTGCLGSLKGCQLFRTLRALDFRLREECLRWRELSNSVIAGFNLWFFLIFCVWVYGSGMY